MKRLNIIWLFLLVCSRIYAHNIYFQELGIVHGLSQSSAISLWQDPIGRIWIGNDALNCYDGENIQVYRFSDYFKKVEDANIHTITGNEDALFVIAETQLIRMDFQTDSFHLTGINTHSVICVDDLVYYFADGNFFEYDWKKEKIKSLLALPEEVTIVRDIMDAGNNILWLATPAGIFIVDIQSGTLVGRMLEEEDITCLYKDSHNCVWIVSRSQHIYTTRSGAFVPQEIVLNNKEKGDPTQTEIFCIQEDIKGTIWFGTLSGMYQVVRENYGNNEVVTVLNHVIPEASVFALYSDRQGTLWIGSYYGDVRYFNPEVDNYVYYPTDEDHPERLHGAVIGVMAEDDQGNIYMGTEGSGVNILSSQTGRFKHLKTEDGLTQNKIRCIWLDEEYNRLYISEYMQGLSYYDLRTKNIRSLRHDILETPYHRIIEEIIPYRNILLLRTQKGLFHMDRKTQQITPLFEDPLLQEYCSGIIRAVHVDVKDVLWVSSFEKGLFTIDMKTEKMIRSYGDGLKDKSSIPSAVLDFCEDKKKGLFMSTLKSGVLAYNPEEDNFINYSEKNHELLSDICYNVCFSWYGNLIVTSNKGISILNLTSREQVNSVHHIRLSSSFPLVALSGDCGLYSSTHEDKIYVGGLYGLLSFSEKDLVVNRSDYMLYFSFLTVNNVPVISPSDILPETMPNTDKIELSHRQNTISLTFASTNYLSTRETIYEYKMEGIDDYWHSTDNKRITYNSLRPGKYKLMVREINNTRKSAEMNIIIHSPFWATTPAILLSLFVVLLISVLLIRFLRSKTQLKTSLEMERKEMVRMEEVNKNKMDFFINISNEFRTPLTLILSQLDRLSHELPGTGRKRLDKIKTQALRLQDLITELLDFRKMEQNKLLLHVTGGDINDFIKRIYLTYIEYANDKQITYRYLHSNQTVMAWFDPKQLQKVIYNLLAFVFKYASQKDSVTVALEKRNKWIEIKITYSGLLPADNSFEYLFSTIHSNSPVAPDLSLLPEGGIGIVFSKGIVKLHKGDLSVVEEEKSISFVLKLQVGNSHFNYLELKADTRQTESFPIVTQDLIEEQENEDQPVFIPADTEEGLNKEEKLLKMLLIEDDDEIRLLLKESFSLAFEVVEMPDASTAYDYIVREVPDIIVAEIMVPGMNGIELCNMLKNNIQTLHIPVILLSSQPSEKQQIESIRCGADDYIVKPFNIELLILRCNYLVKNRKKILHKTSSSKEAGLEITTNTRDRDFLMLAQQVIEDNFANPDFDTTLWSKQLGMGRTRLFSQIKNITGMTPNDYILHVKLNKSLILLSDHSLTIGEIAYELGFSSPAYFSKCFKKQFGVTPADYRKRIE